MPKPLETLEVDAADDSVVSALNEARDRDTVLDTVLDHLHTRFDFCCWLLKKDDVLIGWSARGRGAERVRGHEVSIGEGTTLASVASTGGTHLRALSTEPLYPEIPADFPAGEETSGLLVPVRVGGRISLVLFCARCGVEIEGDQVGALLLLSAHVQAALEGLIIENKSQTESPAEPPADDRSVLEAQAPAVEGERAFDPCAPSFEAEPPASKGDETAEPNAAALEAKAPSPPAEPAAPEAPPPEPALHDQPPEPSPPPEAEPEEPPPEPSPSHPAADAAPAPQDQPPEPSPPPEAEPEEPLPEPSPSHPAADAAPAPQDQAPEPSPPPEAEPAGPPPLEPSASAPKVEQEEPPPEPSPARVEQAEPPPPEPSAPAPKAEPPPERPTQEPPGPPARSSPLRPILVVASLAVVAAGVITGLDRGPPPSIHVTPKHSVVGATAPMSVTVETSAGTIASVNVELAQGDWSTRLAEATGQPEQRVRLPLEVGWRANERLEEGPAELRITAARTGTWLMKPAPVKRVVELVVRKTPPTIEILSKNNTVTQGGAGIVVYHVGETAKRDGVSAAGHWFTGYDLPGGQPGDRFALYAVRHDLASADRVHLEAVDEVGNKTRKPFIDHFEARPMTTDDLVISDQAIHRIVTKMTAEMPELNRGESPLDAYLGMNGPLRRTNAETLIELSKKSRPRFLWDRPFVPINAKVVGHFADRRTYYHNGRKIDQQDHLGLDLASTKEAPIPATNDGVVLWAKRLGIYGGAVVIDHGYGLTSLYGHLSYIAVREGDVVSRGQMIGRSGATGLALGDHVHFSLLVHGMFVNPIDWWNDRWVEEAITSKISSD